jgi:hypothetical protein
VDVQRPDLGNGCNILDQGLGPIDKTHLVMHILQLKKRMVMNFRSSLVSAALIVVGCVSLCAGAEAQGAPGTQSVSSDGTGLVIVGAILIEGDNLVYPNLPCGGGTLIGMGQVTDASISSHGRSTGYTKLSVRSRTTSRSPLSRANGTLAQRGAGLVGRRFEVPTQSSRSKPAKLSMWAR